MADTGVRVGGAMTRRSFSAGLASVPLVLSAADISSQQPFKPATASASASPKQRRHALRKLELALVVSDEGRCRSDVSSARAPRPDGPTFAAI
jgi:hypothetical protein